MTDADKLIEAAKDALQCFPLCLPTFPKTDRLEDETAIRMAEAAIRAVLAELERQGWQCVPKVATPAMVDAWASSGFPPGIGTDMESLFTTVVSDTASGDIDTAYASHDWAVMLDAAPKLEVG